MSEVFIFYLEDADGEIYKKILDIVNEKCSRIQKLPVEIETSFHFRGLDIIPDKHQVFRNGREIILTGREFQIFVLLAENKGRVFSKEQIYDMVWHDTYVYDSRNLTAYINKIRKKIEPDPAKPIYILTIWGVGYKFNEKI